MGWKDIGSWIAFVLVFVVLLCIALFFADSVFGVFEPGNGRHNRMMGSIVALIVLGIMIPIYFACPILLKKIMNYGAIQNNTSGNMAEPKQTPSTPTPFPNGDSIDKVRFCSACGYKLDDEAKFCRSCGRKIK